MPAAKKKTAHNKKPSPPVNGDLLPSVNGSAMPVKRTSRALAKMRRIEMNKTINAQMLRERLAGNVRLTHILRVLSEFQQINQELTVYAQGTAYLTDAQAKAYALQLKA